MMIWQVFGVEVINSVERLPSCGASTFHAFKTLPISFCKVRIEHMYRLEREEFLRSKFIFLWALLGFQAGYINSFGFLSEGRFVSHVTGIGTQAGMAFGDGAWLLGLELTLMPLFFIFGAFLSSLITSVRIERGLKPRYEVIVFVMPAALVLVEVLSFYGFFGEFGAHPEEQRKLGLLFMLALICGMQNGCFATLTKGQIRTTHMTGISTDLGTDLARYYLGSLDQTEARLVRRTNISRIATFVAFMFGSVISALISKGLEYNSLVIPILSSLSAAIAVLKFSSQIKRN